MKKGKSILNMIEQSERSIRQRALGNAVYPARFEDLCRKPSSKQQAASGKFRAVRLKAGNIYFCYLSRLLSSLAIQRGQAGMPRLTPKYCTVIQPAKDAAKQGAEEAIEAAKQAASGKQPSKFIFLKILASAAASSFSPWKSCFATHTHTHKKKANISFRHIYISHQKDAAEGRMDDSALEIERERGHDDGKRCLPSKWWEQPISHGGCCDEVLCQVSWFGRRSLQVRNVPKDDYPLCCVHGDYQLEYTHNPYGDDSDPEHDNNDIVDGTTLNAAAVPVEKLLGCRWRHWECDHGWGQWWWKSCCERLQSGITGCE